MSELLPVTLGPAKKDPVKRAAAFTSRTHGFIVVEGCVRRGRGEGAAAFTSRTHEERSTVVEGCVRTASGERAAARAVSSTPGPRKNCPSSLKGE